MENLRWMPKINPYKLISLYKNYITNNADEADVDNVGIWLYLRCHDIALISDRKCRCPECNNEFDVTNHTNRCQNTQCDFTITREQYNSSWRHKDLYCGNALPAFVHFCEKYLSARNIDQKMILIDSLIHSFHWDIKANLPNRSAGNNLMEGSLKQVVDILDQLSGVQTDNDGFFKETVKKMWIRRKNV